MSSRVNHGNYTIPKMLIALPISRLSHALECGGWSVSAQDVGSACEADMNLLSNLAVFGGCAAENAAGREPTKSRAACVSRMAAEKARSCALAAASADAHSAAICGSDRLGLGRVIARPLR